jgi:hypothetical protein
MSAWIVSKHHIDVIVDGAIRLGLIEQTEAVKTGRMLTNANKRSIQERYGREDRAAATVQTYWYTTPRETISDVVLLKQVNCYDYQTSEIWEYEKTTAYRFTSKMERALASRGVTRDSEGYNEAPWGV